MDIIKRNFFRLLRSGALNEFESLEPMSAFKWNKLFLMIEAQNVLPLVVKGIKNHQYDGNMNIPQPIFLKIEEDNRRNPSEDLHTALSNPLLNKRLSKIHEREIHAIDTSTETLHILDIIIHNIALMLNRGISISDIMLLGAYLRNKGDKVDFVKLDNWLTHLHIQRMAQLEGSILISVFKFEQDEIPFVTRIEPAAYELTLRSVNHAIVDTSKEWHFRQSRSGFVRNNSAVLRRNLRRSVRYLRYAPIETASNFMNNFIRSLSEIEE